MTTSKEVTKTGPCRLVMAVLLLALLLVPFVAEGKDRKDYCEEHEVPLKRCVVYDHPSHTFLGPPHLELGNGDLFTLLVVRTAPDRFLYPLTGVEERFAKPSKESATPYAKPGTKMIPVVHEKRFGGYEFEIQSVSGTAVEGEGPLPALTPTPEPQLIVVETAGWRQSVAGAFTGSDLADPVFSLYPRTGDDGMERFFVDEDPGAEDEARLGLGAFIHLHHSRWDRALGKGGFAWSFGLGLDSDQETSYYFGPAYRLGDKGVITAGAVFGPVDRLPGGVQVCGRHRDACTPDLAVDPNLLSNLDERNEVGFFVALSYTFLDVQDLVEKPFKALSTPKGSQVKEAGVNDQADPKPKDEADDEAEDGKKDEEKDETEEDEEENGEDENGEDEAAGGATGAGGGGGEGTGS